MSKKREAQERAYRKAKQELEVELKERGEWVCLFSGQPIPDDYTWREVAWHHIIGRDGDLICDKRFIRPVANRYHTGDEGYHNKPLSYLKTLWWWDGYLSRLRRISDDLWRREVIKSGLNEC